jgi:hypothetical protein
MKTQKKVQRQEKLRTMTKPTARTRSATTRAHLRCAALKPHLQGQRKRDKAREGVWEGSKEAGERGEERGGEWRGGEGTGWREKSERRWRWREESRESYWNVANPSSSPALALMHSALCSSPRWRTIYILYRFQTLVYTLMIDNGDFMYWNSFASASSSCPCTYYSLRWAQTQCVKRPTIYVNHRFQSLKCTINR